MKLRAFGLQHFFDVAVGIVIILVVGTLLWFRQSKKVEWIEVSMQVMNTEWWWPGSDPQQWYVVGLEKGDKAYNAFGQPIAEIMDLSVVDVGAGRRKANLRLKMEVKYDPQKQQYLFNFQPLQIGKPLELGFGAHNVSGLVSAINNSQQPSEYRLVEITTLKVFPWEAAALQVGMKEIGADGEVSAEIVDVKVTPHTTRVFSDRLSKMVQVTNMDYRDVVTTVRLKSYLADGVWQYVDGTQLKVGDELWLHFPEVVIKTGKISRLLGSDQEQ